MQVSGNRGYLLSKLYAEVSSFIIRIRYVSLEFFLPLSTFDQPEKVARNAGFKDNPLTAEWMLEREEFSVKR